MASKAWHNGKHKREYTSWAQMLKRCSNPRVHNFRNYGGRGITVCERWLVYETFLLDMGECPEGLTLDRKDTNGNYEPSNCRWADWETQYNNRTDNVYLTQNAITLSVSQWARKLGIKVATISQRKRMGYPDGVCLHKGNIGLFLTKDGITQTVAAWSKELDITPSTIYRRKHAGQSDEECLRKQTRP